MSLAETIIYAPEKTAIQHIQQGADVNERDQFGFRPLIQAVLMKKIRVIKALLAAGVDIEQSDVLGRTPLQWASDRGEAEIIQLLLENGADPNHYSADGQPILVNPILREQLEIVELFVSHGANYSFAQDFISAKLIGHRFELTGEADIVSPREAFIPLSFEGFYLEFTCGLIRRSLNNFNNSIPGQKFSQYHAKINKILMALKHASHLSTFARHKDKTPFHPTIDAILDNDLLVLPVGYQGHAITFVKYHDLWAKCDRGVNNLTDTVIIYRIENPYAITNEFLYDLLYLSHSDQYINDELKDILSLKAFKTLPTRSQLSGNCSWANVEASVPAMLYMLSHNDAMDDKRQQGQLKRQIVSFYDKWVEWDKDSSLDEAIHDFHQASPIRQISKASILGSVLTQRCDPNRIPQLKRAKKIMEILTLPNFRFLLKNYIRVYSERRTGAVGKLIIALFKKCGLHLKKLTLKGQTTHPVAQQNPETNAIHMTTALHVACLTGHLESVKHLITRMKIDVNYLDRTGSTALMYAAWKGYLDIVKYLVLEQNADIHISNLKGGTATRYAAYGGHKSVVKFLKKHA